MLTVPFASDRTSASAHVLLPALTYRYVSFLNGTTLTPVVNENLRGRIPDERSGASSLSSVDSELMSSLTWM